MFLPDGSTKFSSAAAVSLFLSLFSKEKKKIARCSEILGINSSKLEILDSQAFFDLVLRKEITLQAFQFSMV